jgi:PIN domain nuclease of toxin-antitoxin system
MPTELRQPGVAQPQLLLLDTHVWVWFMSGDQTKLAPDIVRRIEGAIQGGQCFVSVISIWEVALLVTKGRLHLGGSVDAWVAVARRPPGVLVSELSPEVAIESTRLPAPFHSDPADRILVATARTVGAVLVTSDQRILGYAAAGHVRAIDASA